MFGKLKAVVSVIFITLPRTQFGYVFYCIAPFLLFRYRADKCALSALLLTYFFALFVINLLIYSVSITAFLLESALFLPVVYAVAGGGVGKEKVLRLCALAALVFSLVNMVKVGFPFQLPYRDYLPDYFSGFYGRGGAKLVTVIGFFALVSELNRDGKKSELWLTVALINFVTPNYILGIVCGLAALCISRIRLKNLVLLSFLAFLLMPYVLYRFENLDNSMMNAFGYHPKVLAYLALIELWVEFPHTFFVGTGLGQFSSYPALWSSEYIRAISTHPVPHLPYLFMSEYHDVILGKYLEMGIDNAWAVSSSANKPYVSLVTMIAEMGVFSFFGVFWLLWRRYASLSSVEKYKLKPAILFSIFIMSIDIWHDSPIFLYCLIALIGEGGQESKSA